MAAGENLMQIPWSRPFIGEKEKRAVRRVMDSDWVTQGSETKHFEIELASYLGCREVICVSNGTAALMTALLAHEVTTPIIPAYAYPSLMNLLRTLHTYPIFRDIDPRTIHMIPSNWQKRRGTHIPVSYAGLPLDAEKWKNYDVIEDAAEAFGAESRLEKTGGQGWTTIFSFHVAKLITTIEGGAIATDNPEIAEKCRNIRYRGYLNFQTTDIASAIGRVQLNRVNQFLESRHKIAQCYMDLLENIVEFQEIPNYVNLHPWMMFPIFTKKPRLLAERLGQAGIETRLGWNPLKSYEGAMWVSEHVLCLPIYNDMSLEEAEYVVETLREQI